MTDKEIMTGMDSDGNEVRFIVKKPGAEDYRKSQLDYNKAFREALDSGALLRQKLNDYMRSQNLWDDAKQKQYDKLVKEISDSEDSLKAGGIRLSKAKEIAIGLKTKREEFKILIAERNALDSNSAEALADNARFSSLLRLCIVNPDTRLPYFPEQKDYDAQASQPWVVTAAEKLANILYDLDPDYEQNLEENKFLKEFEFVNEKLELINEDGHLIDSEGRLINEDGRYIAYRTDDDYKNKENPYFVNRSGEEVVLVNDEWVTLKLAERKPFLDDEDQPIELKKEDSAPEEVALEDDNTSEELKEEKKKTRAVKKSENTI
jgi:hypothetical protein